MPRARWFFAYWSPPGPIFARLRGAGVYVIIGGEARRTGAGFPCTMFDVILSRSLKVSMRFFAVGLNHECASLDRTEAFALDGEDQDTFYANLNLTEGAEVIVLSTCNRTEAYLYGTQADVRQVEAMLGQAAGEPWPEEDAFHRRDEAAVRHLLEVTSGLRSMVLGDAQILAQVKAAYERAVDVDAVQSLLHRLLHTAFRAAKRVSSETQLESGAASVSTAAVELARQDLATNGEASAFSGSEIVLVGAGRMGQLALKALAEDSVDSLTVVNRSDERAADVADSFGGQTGDWDRRHEIVSEADLAIVATGAPEPILDADGLPKKAEASPTLLVDIAMPRNVDPDVETRGGYRLYDLDDLNAWTERVQERRADAVPEAREICQEELEEFVTWVFHQQALEPAIQAIRRTFDTIREQEVERHAHRTDMDREEVDRLTQSIMQKLLAVPIVRLKNIDPDSIDFVQGIELLHALFAPSDSDESRRCLETMGDDHRPSLADAPSHCPYLTHDASADARETQRVRRALRMTNQNGDRAEREIETDLSED